MSSMFVLIALETLQDHGGMLHTKEELAVTPALHLGQRTKRSCFSKLRDMVPVSTVARETIKGWEN